MWESLTFKKQDLQGSYIRFALGNISNRENQRNMRTLLLCASVAISSYVFGQNAFINEVDYDQPGTDNAEFVEVAVDASSCPGGCDLSLFTLEFYNGTGGLLYATHSVPSTVVGVDGGFSLLLLDFSPSTDQIQNGGNDGIALIFGGTVVQYISYEGPQTASNGTASGLSATSITASENNSNPNLSVQRTPSGTYESSSPTKGMANVSPLPVQLASFNVRAEESMAKLAWATASEQDNDFFAIEMSRNGSDFSEVARVSGQGSSQNWVEYSHEVALPEPGRYYFRLRQVDFDGLSSTSEVVSVERKGERTGLRLINTSVHHELEVELGQDATLQIIDINGRQLSSFNLTQGLQRIDVAQLPQGLYILSNGQESFRFIRR